MSPREKKPAAKLVLPAGLADEVFAGAPVPRPAPPAAPSPAVAPAVSKGADVALYRRILQARAPLALAEVEAGILEAAKGDAALLAWLARPFPREESADPLEAVTAALGTAAAYVARLAPTDRRAATLLNSASTLAKTVEAITAKRPREPTSDEVAERIKAVRDEAVRRIVEHTAEARAALTAERKGLSEWAAENLGPAMAVELERRVSAMLGEEGGRGE